MTNEAQLSLPGFGAPNRTGLRGHGLYLAIRPDASACDAAMGVCARVRRKGDSRVKPENLHVSLLQLGSGSEIPQTVIEMACRRMLSIASPPVPLRFDKVESIERAQDWCVVLASSQGLGALYQLQCQLVREFSGKDWRGSHMPHMTLLYARRPVEKQPVAPICWTAQEFVLIHSYRGTGRQEIVARRPLR